MDPRARNIVYHHGRVERADRESLLGQRGLVLWFTGLSGSGKSTIARALEEHLYRSGRLVHVLDGDNVRHGLCSDLGFTDEDRAENIRRVAEVAALFVDAGLIVPTAFISPFRSDRAAARAVVGDDRFVEVFVDAPLDTCEQRDPKGLYAKVRRGEISNFTGIDSSYEPPVAAEIVLPTDELEIDACVDRVVTWLDERGHLSATATDPHER